MKTTLLTFIFALAMMTISNAQATIVSKTINEIELKSDTIKSVFEWITDNIKYDVKKLNEMKNRKGPKKKSDFDNKKDYQDDQLKKVIKRRKGVCEDYSLLFNTIVSQLGYESYVITGYTKNSNGKLNRTVGHTWNAVKVKGKWRLYDPTWGAGYLKNNKKFVKHYNKEWYDVPSEQIIITHMPYDPIWQLSNNPISYKAFEQSNFSTKFTSNYNYNELIQIHINKSEKEQIRDELNRSKELGNGIKIINKWRKRITKNINHQDFSNQMYLFNNTSEKLTNSVNIFNKYIDAKNNRFKGRKWTVDYAKQQLLREKLQVNESIEIFDGLDVKDKKAKNMIKRTIKQTEGLLRQIDSELKYLEKL